MGILEGIIESRHKQNLDSWRMLAENYNMPPQEFYGLLEAAVRTRNVPEAVISQVEFKESNLLSDRRIYLRLERDSLLFDCCAAPFGNGYLFSYWLWRLPVAFTLFHFLGMFMTLGVFISLAIRNFGLVEGSVLLAVGMANLYLIGRLRIFRGQRSLEEFIHGLSLIGVVYELFFRCPSYFEIDTAFAFNESINRALVEVLDGLSKTHSLRALTEDERKPVMRDFYKKLLRHE